ncbi:MAG: SSS family transporter [Marivirga sp.]|jgi:SSS family transporter
MSPVLVISIIAAYFIVLMLIAHFTSKGGDNTTFFTANRQSPWYLVAFGMIGASLSGVTFISVPGEVGNTAFSYFQVVLGYLVGYLVIATVLLPLYYRLNLISIYSYLEDRFGPNAYRTGAFFFLLSRVVGSSFRLFLVAGVLQLAIFDAYGWPFSITVAITIALIWLYTFRGGIKTIVWTDTLQTFFMILAVVVSIYLIKDALDMSWTSMVDTLQASKYSKIFTWEVASGQNFWKQFISGAFIAIVMTGLDQDMMQKNLTCRSLKDAQKNMFWFCVVLVIVNFFFLTMGALLYLYAEQFGVPLPARTDDLFPLLALNHFPLLASILFLLGIIAAAYSSADSALTALTTSFCVDFLGLGKNNQPIAKQTRIKVHLAFSFLLFIVVLAFNAINDQSVITAVFVAAGYTYGPILGLFAFGLFTKWQVKDKWVPLICFLSPIISYLLNQNSAALFGGFKFGFLILVVNGLLTFIGLYFLKVEKKIVLQ